MRQQQREQVFEEVGVRDGQPEFFQECFEVLLRRLLAEEAELVMKRLASPAYFGGEPVIAFGLSHPLAGCLFHKGLCLSR